MSVRSFSLPRSKKSQFNIKQVRSQEGDTDLQSKTNTQWYENKTKKITNLLPSSIPLMKHSQPFRLTIMNITGFQPSKKSANSQIYLKISLTLITNQMEPIGITYVYQCQTPYNSKNKQDMNICLYYHSKIDKGCNAVKIVIRLDYIEIREGLVEGVIGVGIGVINDPFIEDDHKDVKLFKECSEVEVVGGLVDNLTATGVYLTYSLQSSLQLKNLIKLLPSQTIVSSQTQIAGILGSYLPSSKDASIQEQDILFISIDVCEIQIPQKFQSAVNEAVSLLSATPQTLTHRKIVCGYHNQFQIISPVSRILQSSGRITTGGDTINAYQALSDGEVIKIPYYFEQEIDGGCCAVTLSLVYVYGKSEYQVCVFAFEPNVNAQRQELSVRMITGSGTGFVSNLLPVKINKNPTLICEYISEDFHKAREYRRSIKVQQKRNSKQSDLESSRVVMAELEKERLDLEREKSELEILRTQNLINHQDDFEKKLQEQKHQLRIRQEMIQNQYKQEVQKQIRLKIQLENQIRAMKQKLTAIQQNINNQNQSPKLSHDQSPAEYNRDYQQTFSDGQTGNMMRHRINADYLVEEDKTIPISDIRDMMARTIQINNETIEKELELFYFGSKFSFMFNSVVWSTNFEPPKTFYLVIKFFNFKQFRSDPIGYIESGHQYCQLVRWNNYAHNFQNATPCYQFTVDPSEFSNPKILQQDLVHFLSKNSTIIDIFDAENFLYIGQINIKMHELFRGNKSQTMIAKEYNLVKMKKQQNFGTIQVLIRNQMVQCQEQIEIKENRKVKQVRKKVISNNPIHLSKQIVSETSNIEKMGGMVQVKNRQQKRIEMYKKKVSEKKSNRNFDDLESKQKGYMIDKINEYKQKKMPHFIQNIYEQMLSQTITINPYFGQTKTFTYQFTNISQGPASFRVTVQNSTQELELVKSVAEWKHFVNQNGYAVPKIYDCINDQNSFYLAAGQTIPLVFKYLSFQKSGTNNQKTINVTITKQQNSWVVGGFSLNVQSHHSIINHSYILYQPGNQIVDLIIPVIYSSNDSRAPKRLFLTVQNAQAEWLNQYQILLRIKVPQIMNKLKFNMLLYEDDYFCKLRENWLVELFAYEGVYAVSREDQKTIFKISIPEQVISSMRPHKVSFFSSYPGLVFQSNSLEGVKLARGSAEIWCQLFPDKDLIGSIQITCVSEKGELLYGWIVQIYPYTPKIT